MERLHRNVCEGVVNCLNDIFFGGKYADKAIERTLKSNPKWGSRDRKFIAETVYESVRWYRLLQYIANCEPNDFWKISGAWLLSNGTTLPPWKEWSSLDASSLKSRYEEAKKTRKIIHSIPDWLDELASNELGENWENVLLQLNEPAEVILRVNTLKTNLQSLKKTLLLKNIATENISFASDALVLSKRQNIFSLPEFQNGLFEVQDGGSQLIAPFLRAEPGMRVIDACAGAGGKSLHLAALLQNKGKIIAMDVEEWKLNELQKRAKRAGINTIETRLIDSLKAIKRLENSADRLLLDVPCSGLGVLKRNPDAKWKLKPENIEQVKNTQKEILETYSLMLKSGGLMVYATCSILPSENTEQVKYFLSKNPLFEWVDEKIVLPTTQNDGFYMALLQKK